MNLNDLDKSANKLINLYKSTYRYILSEIQRKIDLGLSDRHQRTMLKEIQSELKKLDEEAFKWSHNVLPEYYKLGISTTDIDVALLSDISLLGDSINLNILHRKAIENAANDLYLDLAKNTFYMEAEAKRIIRNNASEIINRSIITGESQKKIKSELRNQLQKDGIHSFIDSSNKRWKIDKYTDMAVRTKSRILHNDGTLNRLKEYQIRYPANPNFDYVQISSHGAEDWCRNFEGTVWSISGRSQEYPPVSSLPNGYSTLHPNCKHVFLPYIPALRGKGDIVSDSYIGKSVKELNKQDYHIRKAS
ncbi:phage minor capsid protein [Candidatus Contubernalis alkaliaceticus]|uniref:phage minor capsid protein n=1 Tax=Candidatus Contubernalis alkaliaceticus TaxID=338645 RepID=UPI001F4C15B8|nr:phage minor capsid protein [Candidatus Contubernalis alkalaceticus]UNC92719.1 hypothetical protein HUE98_11800 [Candidatus Contubernalis alkalaceticus]